MKRTIALAAMGLALGGCSTVSSTGTSIGKFVGVPQTSAPPAGRAIINALGGGLLGNAASQMSGSERAAALQAEYRALEYGAVGQTVPWGDKSGHNGDVVAAAPYRVGSQDCRQYTHTIRIGPQPQPQVLRGTACRETNGIWTPLT